MKAPIPGVLGREGKQSELTLSLADTLPPLCLLLRRRHFGFRGEDRLGHGCKLVKVGVVGSEQEIEILY
jgi:hypothetical protein